MINGAYILKGKITKTIIQSCISQSPDDRPSFDDLYCTLTKNKYLLV